MAGTVLILQKKTGRFLLERATALLLTAGALALSGCGDGPIIDAGECSNALSEPEQAQEPDWSTFAGHYHDMRVFCGHGPVFAVNQRAATIWCLRPGQPAGG